MGERLADAGILLIDVLDVYEQVHQTAGALHSISGRHPPLARFDHVWIPSRLYQALCHAFVERGTLHFHIPGAPCRKHASPFFPCPHFLFLFSVLETFPSTPRSRSQPRFGICCKFRYAMRQIRRLMRSNRFERQPHDCPACAWEQWSAQV